MTRYTGVDIDGKHKFVRLGIDISPDLKKDAAIKAKRLDLTIKEILTRFLRAWLAGEIKLPEK